MNCSKCGNVIQNDSKFCMHCGTKVVVERNPMVSTNGFFSKPGDLSNAPSKQNMPDAPSAVPRKETPKKKKSKKIPLILGVSLSAVLVVAICVALALNNALVKTGSKSYRYFGKLCDLVSERPGIIAEIAHDDLKITCTDYTIFNGLIDDSIDGITRYQAGIEEFPEGYIDRFMKGDIEIVDNNTGWKYFFESYGDVIPWVNSH